MGKGRDKRKRRQKKLLKSKKPEFSVHKNLRQDFYTSHTAAPKPPTPDQDDGAQVSE